MGKSLLVQPTQCKVAWLGWRCSAYEVQWQWQCRNCSLLRVFSFPSLVPFSLVTSTAWTANCEGALHRAATQSIKTKIEAFHFPRTTAMSVCNRILEEFHGKKTATRASLATKSAAFELELNSQPAGLCCYMHDVDGRTSGWRKMSSLSATVVALSLHPKYVHFALQLSNGSSKSLGPGFAKYAMPSRCPYICMHTCASPHLWLVIWEWPLQHRVQLLRWLLIRGSQSPLS